MVDLNIEQYEALRSGAGCLDLIDRRWIALSGSERADYLQGLVTNDVAALPPGAGCYATYLTPQGRMIADMLVFAEDDRLLLDVHESVADQLRERFEDLIFTEDVTVRALGPDRAPLGVHGPRSARVISAVVGPVEPTLGVHEHRPMAFGGRDGLLARTDDLGIEGFRLIVDRGIAAALAAALVEAGGVRVEAPAAETVRVESGRPAFPIDMDSETIPLEAGIEDRAIDFDKGCYVGQEVIIRILHRGQGRVARRLVGLALNGTAAPDAPLPQAGAAVWSASDDDDADADIGRLTSVATSPALGKVIALGYVPRELADKPGSTVDISVGDGRARAVVTRLPFVPTS